MNQNKFVVINIKVIPKSSVTKFEKSGNEYKLKIKSPPVDGKANKEIVEFFSEYFSIPKNNVLIEKGEFSRHKSVRLIGISEDELNL